MCVGFQQFVGFFKLSLPLSFKHRGIFTQLLDLMTDLLEIEGHDKLRVMADKIRRVMSEE